jgi:hypothetical protein
MFGQFAELELPEPVDGVVVDGVVVVAAGVVAVIVPLAVEELVAAWVIAAPPHAMALAATSVIRIVFGLCMSLTSFRSVALRPVNRRPL